MQLIIDKKYNKNFVYKYLPELAIKLLNQTCNYTRIKQINSELQIDTLGIIKLALLTMLRSESTIAYTLIIDKRIMVKDIPLDTMINYITYGNRTFKGYPILLNIFNSIVDNLDELYKGWLKHGY